jgi:hypothetical protein
MSTAECCSDQFLDESDPATQYPAIRYRLSDGKVADFSLGYDFIAGQLKVDGVPVGSELGANKADLVNGTVPLSQIPGLPWSKITSGKPTTLAGYGITDAVFSGGTGVLNLSGYTITMPAALNPNYLLTHNNIWNSGGPNEQEFRDESHGGGDRHRMSFYWGDSGNWQLRYKSDAGAVISVPLEVLTNLSVQIGTSLRVEDDLIVLNGVISGDGSGLTNLPGGIGDGDKGDIIVSGSGSVWTIEDDAVTYAKMQSVSASARLLGRNTAGAGNIEEIGFDTLAEDTGIVADADYLLGWEESASALRKVLHKNVKPIESFVIAVTNETTPISAGVKKLTFRMPYAFTVTAVRASLTVASTSGSVVIDINENVTSFLSPKITIEVNEKTSTTAAVQPGISNAPITDAGEVTIDIDSQGTGATGLKVYLIGYKT